jgi:hypothetical protein
MKEEVSYAWKRSQIKGHGHAKRDGKYDGDCNKLAFINFRHKRVWSKQQNNSPIMVDFGGLLTPLAVLTLIILTGRGKQPLINYS